MRRVRRRLRSILHRLFNPALDEGALTRSLLATHCVGSGAEVGPGRRRLGDRDRTITFDRYRAFIGNGKTDVDVIADGSDLPLRDGLLDYLISAHCLEHVPDTLGYLEEWLRVLKGRGCLLLILPHMDRTFDRGRPLSTLEHHLAERGVSNDPERPLHWEEWERRLLRDRPAWLQRQGATHADGSINARYAAERAYIHYHCWTQNEMIRVLQHLDCEVLAAVETLPERTDSFLLLARKHNVDPPKQRESTGNPMARRADGDPSTAPTQLSN